MTSKEQEDRRQAKEKSIAFGVISGKESPEDAVRMAKEIAEKSISLDCHFDMCGSAATLMYGFYVAALCGADIKSLIAELKEAYKDKDLDYIKKANEGVAEQAALVFEQAILVADDLPEALTLIRRYVFESIEFEDKVESLLQSARGVNKLARIMLREKGYSISTDSTKTGDRFIEIVRGSFQGEKYGALVGVTQKAVETIKSLDANEVDKHLLVVGTAFAFLNLYGVHEKYLDEIKDILGSFVAFEKEDTQGDSPSSSDETSEDEDQSLSSFLGRDSMKFLKGLGIDTSSGKGKKRKQS